MNPRKRALGETVLRVKDLQRVKRFYTDVVGPDILREFEGIAFLKVSNGHGGHTQIIGLFHESLPVPFPKDLREPVHLESTSLHHFALEIDKGDFKAELDRLQRLAPGCRGDHIRASMVPLAVGVRSRPRGQHSGARVL